MNPKVEESTVQEILPKEKTSLLITNYSVFWFDLAKNLKRLQNDLKRLHSIT